MFFSRKDLFSWDSGFEAFLNRQTWLPCPLLHPCALALSFFGMRFWVFIGMRLSPDPLAKARGLPSSSGEEDRAS
jgi:hypothetical protein